MARRDDDISIADDPFFVTGRGGDRTQTQVVTGAPVKIYRAAGSGSFSQSGGVEVDIEWLERPADDWVPNESELADTVGSDMSGFARYAALYGDQHPDQARFPIESSLPTPEMEKRILEAADANETSPDPRRRIHRDPVTQVPENFAAVDRMSESDSFFGKDKVEPETDAVLQRMKHVERTRERVDYKTSKAMPIKVIRRS